jgi:hypothetical protein
MLSKQQRDLSSRVTESYFSSLWSPCYGNFDKQSTAPKQPLVTIPSPMVMPIFVAQNPQLSYTTPNISVLEVADSRKPLTSSLETTYATPRQAAVGAPIDMVGKPSRTAIPHLARSISLRLDLHQYPSLVLQTASVNTTRSGRISHSQPQTQPVKKIFLPRSRLWNFCPLHKSIRLAKASTTLAF